MMSNSRSAGRLQHAVPGEARRPAVPAQEGHRDLGGSAHPVRRGGRCVPAGLCRVPRRRAGLFREARRAGWRSSPGDDDALHAQTGLIVATAEEQHLGAIPRKQVEIERAVRAVRTLFIDRRPRAPKRGTIHRIMLVGPYTRPRATPDRETGDINDYDISVFVDPAAYKGMNRYWGLARRVVASSLCSCATNTLSVFTRDEIGRLQAAGNRFFTDQYDRGVVLSDRDDPPA